jgi:hypothetical protein
MPGAFDGETVNRRRFMTATVHGAGAVAAAAFTLPALGFALGPVFSRLPWSWQAIGKPDDFVETTYVIKVITIVQGIGESGKTITYVRKRDPDIDKEPSDQYNQWIALSSRCMPGPLRPGGRAFHLPVSRRRLRLPRDGRGWAAGPPARSVLHPQEPADRPD